MTIKNQMRLSNKVYLKDDAVKKNKPSYRKALFKNIRWINNI